MKLVKLIGIIGLALGLMVPPVFADAQYPKWHERYPLIAHGMGNIDDIPITNSLEAFMYNYVRGHRVFEVDFGMTRDKQVVAYHDVGTYYKYTENYIPALEKFKNTKLLNKYSTLTLQKLIRLMNVHEDMYIVTDVKDYTKDMFKGYITEIVTMAQSVNPEILERIIVQVYNEETYNWAQEIYPFKNMIFTTYASGMSDNQIIAFSKARNISVVTTPPERLSQGFVSKLHHNNLEVYTHTINTKKEVEYYKSMGVDGFYTDSLNYGNIQ